MNRLVLTALLGATACNAKTHLQYDHGRAYRASMSTQADLSRPSVSAKTYPLTGVEGLALRAEVAKQTTDSESGVAEATKTFQIK
jgi:hypothetical protein